MVRYILLFGLACLACVASAPCAAQPAMTYTREWQAWRAERERELKAPRGWLSLAGLFWLAEGEATFGSAPDNELVLPTGGPDYLGRIIRKGDSVWFAATPGVQILHENMLAETALLYPGGGLAQAGRFSWVVIRRGDRIGLRLWDEQHPALQAFLPIPHFPVRKKWCLRAAFVSFAQPRILHVTNVLGMQVEQKCPGVLRFKAGGKRYELLALEESAKTLLVIFADATTGVQTYGGGRYLQVKLPDNQRKIIVDFNKAYNPPCVFTPYATCLLPPAENRLPIPVSAGERSYDAQGIPASH